MDWLPINNVRTLTAQIRTPEVRLATWLRKTFVLKPAIERARKERAEHRNHVSDQLDQFN